jgi:hypothetical protein
MRRVIRRQLSSHVMGILLCLLGLSLLFAVLYKAWAGVSASNSSDLLSSMWSYILTAQLKLGSIVMLRLSYLSIMGTIFLVLGIIVLAYSRQVFYLSGESVLLQCPYCKNQWRTSRAKGWAECPHCRQFIRPQVAKKSTRLD